MMTKTKTTIDHTTFTTTFKGSMSVPREDVFEAWTDPDQNTDKTLDNLVAHVQKKAGH